MISLDTKASSTGPRPSQILSPYPLTDLSESLAGDVPIAVLSAYHEDDTPEEHWRETQALMAKCRRASFDYLLLREASDRQTWHLLLRTSPYQSTRLLDTICQWMMDYDQDAVLWRGRNEALTWLDKDGDDDQVSTWRCDESSLILRSIGGRLLAFDAAYADAPQNTQP